MNHSASGAALTPARERSSTKPTPRPAHRWRAPSWPCPVRAIVRHPGVLGEALRTGAGPAALIVTKADINLVAGAMVAESLYGVDCPVLLVDGETFASLTTGTRVEHAGPGSLVD